MLLLSTLVACESAGSCEQLDQELCIQGQFDARGVFADGDGGWIAGSNTTHHEMITLAGLRNAAEGRSDYVRASFEDLITYDPDFIVVGDIGSGTETTSALLRTEPTLADLRAVREDRILRVPARLISSSSQEIVTGAEFLVDAIERWLAERERR